MNNIPTRSTKEQRQAYTEALYCNYGELQHQAEELIERRHKVDVDNYDSNAKEIHGLLFADDFTAHADLGDWSTYERIQNIMKKVVYGRSANLYSMDEKDNALKKNLDVLEANIAEHINTINKLEEDLRSSQQEVSGLLNLISLKDSEIRNLTGKANRNLLQMRFKERENNGLRRLNASLNDQILTLKKTEADKTIQMESLSAELLQVKETLEKWNTASLQAETVTSPDTNPIQTPVVETPAKDTKSSKTGRQTVKSENTAGEKLTTSKSSKSLLTNATSVSPASTTAKKGKESEKKGKSGVAAAAEGPLKVSTTTGEKKQQTQSKQEGGAASSLQELAAQAEPSTTSPHTSEAQEARSDGDVDTPSVSPSSPFSENLPGDTDANRGSESQPVARQESEGALSPGERKEGLASHGILSPSNKGGAEERKNVGFSSSVDDSAPQSPPFARSRLQSAAGEASLRLSKRASLFVDTDEMKELQADLGLLIEANRQLEKENYLLRGRLQNIILPDTVVPQSVVGQGVEGERGTPSQGKNPPVSSLSTAWEKTGVELFTEEKFETIKTAPIAAALETAEARRELINRELPQTAVIVKLNRRTGLLQRRMEMECQNAMSWLDYDANPIPRVEFEAQFPSHILPDPEEEEEGDELQSSSWLSGADPRRGKAPPGLSVEELGQESYTSALPSNINRISLETNQVIKSKGSALQPLASSSEQGKNVESYSEEDGGGGEIRGDYHDEGGEAIHRPGGPTPHTSHDGEVITESGGGRGTTGSSSYANKVRESVNSSSQQHRLNSLSTEAIDKSYSKEGERRKPPRPTGNQSTDYYELFLSSNDTAVLYCDGLRGDLDQIRKDFLALREEMKLFFEVLPVSLESLEEQYRGIQESNARQVQEAFEKFAEDFISNNTEEKVTNLLRQTYGIDMARKPLSSDMTDQEWIAQQLTNIALDVAKEKVKEQEDKLQEEIDGQRKPKSEGGTPVRAESTASEDFPSSVHSSGTRPFFPTHNLGAGREGKGSAHSGKDGVRYGSAPPSSSSGQTALPGNGDGLPSSAGLVKKPLESIGAIKGHGRPSVASRDPNRGSTAPSEEDHDPFNDTNYEDVTKLKMEGKRLMGKPTRPSAVVNWYPDLTDDDFPLMVGNPQENEIRKRFHNRVDVMQLLKTMQPHGANDVSQIRPTVYHYAVPRTIHTTTDRLRQKLKVHQQVVEGDHFNHLVRDQVFPIASKAEDIRKGRVDTQLYTAVKELREEEQRRKKQHADMLFRQVATNLRTKQLLRRSVYRGNAFSAYVSLLYKQWRREQQKVKMQKKNEYVQLRNHVLLTCGLKPPGTTERKPNAPLPPLRTGKSKAPKPAPKYTYGQGKSSMHFSDVHFE